MTAFFQLRRLQRSSTFALAIAVASWSSTAARAHQPTISDGSATSFATALVFEDIQLSRVVYHEVTRDAEQLWLSFNVDQPQDLLVSLGVPLIDRLEAFRPALAVLGPGLPDVDLPFEMPPGVGGQEFSTTDVLEPEVFDEPFSGTSSWILNEVRVDLPEPGTYFIVAYVPSGETGKLWVAPGEREEFGLDDILELSSVVQEVQAFHEIANGAVPCLLFPAVAVLLALPLLGRARP